MAAPEFTLFVKPYLEGYEDGEEGNTPITAEILNENYDAFLLALNEWATSVGLILEEAVTDPNYVHTDNNYTTTEKDKLSGIDDNANNYSLPTASTSTLGGVKVDGITITIANGVISAVGGGGTDVEGNPSGTPTAVLSSIRIGNNIFSIPGGGGGGSSVSFTQILATGTKIGTITIDGVPTDIYAPTPPTNTSDLNNDSNFVSDANYVHTDNNYTTTEKNKLADLNQVEANPSSGTSAGDLTSIKIGGTKYNIPSGGGGGTTVVANPSGTVTDELEKIQIGNTIYSVSSGGGGVTYDKGYSTTEKAVCAWTDGTTVYQKTFIIDGDGSTRSFTVQTGITNGKRLVDAQIAGLRYDSARQWWSPCYMNIDDFSWSTCFTLSEDFSEFNIKANQYGIKNIAITLRYTKTTDVPFEGALPLNELSDVDITTPTDGQVLGYNSTSGKWENINQSGGASWTDVTGTLAAGETSITLSSPAITPDSSIEPWTDTYGVVPTNMEVVQSSSVVDKEIILERNTDYTAGMDIIIKDGTGTIISTETINGNDYIFSNPYVITDYLSIYFDTSSYRWVIKFLKDCEDNGVEKQENDIVYTYYTSSFVTQDIKYFTLGYGVQMTFEARQAALGVKVRVS